MDQIAKSNAVDREYWNIVKGIGIICVVLGHVWPDAVRFVYIFHLPLFFFVSGYLYNEEKYGDNPYLNVVSRIKSSWMKYVLAFWVLIWLHNWMAELKMLYFFADIYSLSDIVYQMADALMGGGHECMGFALWFVPVSVVANCMLGFVVTISRKVQKITKQTWTKYLFQLIVIGICGFVGYLLEAKQIMLTVNIQVALVVMPFLWVGYLLRNFVFDFKKYLNVFVFIASVVAVYFISRKYLLDLGLQSVYPFLHLGAFIGIYMSLYAAKIIQKIPYIRTLLNTYGRASFWIMFAHLPLCRLFDWAYINMYHKDEFEKLYYTLKSVIYAKTFWPIYIFIGLGVSIVLFVFYDKVRAKLRKYC